MKFGTLYAYWTHEWHGDYLVYAKKVKDLGFDILEISAGDLLEMSDAQLIELKNVCRDLDISITSNIGPAKDKDVASKDPQIRENGINFLSNIMEKMDILDSRILAGVIYTCWPSQFDDLDKPAMWDRSVKSVKQLAKVANSYGIDYCLEVVNRFETTLLNTVDEALVYCKEIDNPSVKLLLDTFHMNIEEDNIPDAIRKAEGLLGHLHVGEGNRNLPGKGSLPWAEIGKALNDINYQAGVVMEPFVQEGGQVGTDIKVWRNLAQNLDDETMNQNIADSLKFLKSKFGV